MVSHFGSDVCEPNIVCQAITGRQLSMRAMQELTYIAYLSRLTKGQVLIQYMEHQV